MRVYQISSAVDAVQPSYGVVGPTLSWTMTELALVLDDAAEQLALCLLEIGRSWVPWQRHIVSL